jgi:hypothetical protein
MTEETKKPLTGLWRRNPETPEGKYLVKRRDGSVVEWPNLVMGARENLTTRSIMVLAQIYYLRINECFLPYAQMFPK